MLSSVKVRDRMVLVGSDFSQQEPRLLAAFSNDKSMIDAYKAGKDLYATIAAGVYKNDYWDNMEHHQDGSPNPEGKKRRSNCKSLLLGIMYGRGIASIAEQTGCTLQEAQKIIDDFYKGFPAVKKWTEETQINVKKTGYVEDLWGRRRRLPDILRPPVEVKYIDKSRAVVSTDFNPLIGATGKYTSNVKSELDIYKERALAARGRQQMEKLKAEALSKGIEIHENGGFIAQAERQAVNARIQGSAATCTKIAMIRVHNDQKLKDLGFSTLISVHDELIGECPKENAQEVADRLCYLMKTCIENDVTVPFKCDPTITYQWYSDEVAAKLQELRDKELANGKSIDQIKKEMLEDHEELLPDELDDLLAMEL